MSVLWIRQLREDADAACEVYDHGEAKACDRPAVWRVEVAVDTDHETRLTCTQHASQVVAEDLPNLAAW